MDFSNRDAIHIRYILSVLSTIHPPCHFFIGPACIFSYLCHLWTSPTCFSSTTIIKGIVFLRRGRVTNEGHGMAGSTWIMGISRDPVNVAWPISLWDLCHSLACLPACAWRDHFFFDSYGISSHMSQAFLPRQIHTALDRSIRSHSRQGVVVLSKRWNFF